MSSGQRDVFDNEGDALGWMNYRPFGPTSDQTVILKLNKYNHLRDLPWKMSEIRRLITDSQVCVRFWGLDFKAIFWPGGTEFTVLLVRKGWSIFFDY